MKTLIKNRKDYQSWKNGYYHLSSDGWQEGKLFNNEQQFAFGMTLMGLITLRFEIVIYDFTLMDDHFHILMSGKGAKSAISSRPPRLPKPCPYRSIW